MEILAAQETLERRQREAPMLFFHRMLKEHEKQKEFFRHLAQGKRRVLFSGGNRSGKTTAGSHQALATAIGYRYWEIPDLVLTEGIIPPREQIPTKHWVRRADGVPVRMPNQGLIITGSSRLRGIGQTIFPYLWSQLPLRCKEKTKVHRGAQGVPEYIELWNGSTLLFASAQQEDMTLESFIADWAWADEPISQSQYAAIWARLVDYLGTFFFTLTPLKALSAWLHRLFYTDEPVDTAVVKVSIYENPGMTPEQIEAFRRDGNFTPAEERARVFGDFEFFGNRIFDRFDPKAHIIAAWIPPHSWIHGHTVDPHHKRPAFMLFWAYNPNTKQFVFYKEWPPSNFFKMRAGGKTPQEYAAIIRQIEGACRRRITVFRCDPRFGKAEHLRHGVKESAWVHLMAQHGIYYDANIKNLSDLEYRHQAINEMLFWDRNYPLSGSNLPRILITEDCPNTIEAFCNYGYRDDDDPEKGLYRQVSEEFKDPIDCVAYTVLKPVEDWRRTGIIQTFSEKDLEREGSEDYYYE